MYIVIPKIRIIIDCVRNPLIEFIYLLQKLDPCFFYGKSFFLTDSNRSARVYGVTFIKIRKQM